jgi:hypothetical protein
MEIFNLQLLEEKINEIKTRSYSLNESQINSIYNKYPRDVFSPLNDYLTEAFYDNLLKRGKDFANSFSKSAKTIATKIADSIEQFSFRKVFATVTKMMQKIKAKVLKELMILLDPLREPLIRLKFSTEENKFDAKKCFSKLVEIAKSTGKDIGAVELLNDKTVSAIGSNINLAGTEALRESVLNEFTGNTTFTTTAGSTPKAKSQTIEAKKGAATFNSKDVKYLDFFQKMMFKLGVKDAKINGFLSEVTKKITQGAAISGIFTILAAILPSTAVLTSIAGIIGTAIAAAPVLVMIIGAILFGIGLFMFATWLLKPYPTVLDCETFLASIFDGSNLFDFPEVNLGTYAETAVPIKKLKKTKPTFNTEVILQLSDEGVEEDIPQSKSKKSARVVKLYDDLDIETLENEEQISNNIVLIRKFSRNIFSVEGRKKIKSMLEDDIDENENDYAELLQDLLIIVEKCLIINSREMNKDGSKKFPFAINSQKLQTYLKGKNKVKNKLAKIIDSVDNFVDRVDNSKK